MTPMMTSILIGVLVAGVLVAVLMMFIRGNEDGRAADRLDQLVGRGGRRNDSSADMLLRQALQDVDKKNILDALTPEALNLAKVVEQADVNIKPAALTGAGLLLGVLGFVASGVGVNWYVAPVVGLALTVTPFGWLFWKRADRLKRFQAQLPDGMELVARALRAGHSLAAGMHVVAEEMPAPISKEFGRVYEEQNLGIPLEDCLKGMCDRVPNLDLRFFVTSVAIQRQTGGDLAEILDRIGYVIRERAQAGPHRAEVDLVANARPAQVRFDQDHALATRRHRSRQVDRDAGLAFSGARAGDQDHLDRLP